MKYLELKELTYFNGETHSLVYDTETNKYSVILKEYDNLFRQMYYNEDDNFISSLQSCVTHIIENTFKSIVYLANNLKNEGFKSVALVKTRKRYNNDLEKEYYTVKANLTDLEVGDIILNVYNLNDEEDFENLVEQVKQLSNKEYQNNFIQFMK